MKSSLENSDIEYLLDVYKSWSDEAISNNILSEESSKIYLSMWRKFSASMIKLSKHGVHDLAELSGFTLDQYAAAVAMASESSATSYPKRMAQLVTRVVSYHTGQKHHINDLPGKFTDKRQQSPVYLKQGSQESLSVKDDQADSPDLFKEQEYSSWKSARNKAIAAVSVYAGLKLQEIVNLKIKDLDFDQEGYIFNVTGSMHRVVPIAKEGNAILASWIEELRQLFMHEDDAAFSQHYLFVSTLSGKNMTKITAHRAIKDALDQQTATAARNTFALRQIAGGVSSALVQGWMGYKTNFTVDKHVQAIKDKKVPSKHLAGTAKVRPNGI